MKIYKWVPISTMEQVKVTVELMLFLTDRVYQIF